MKDDQVYLRHIRDALESIDNYTQVGRDIFFSEAMRQDAVVRRLQVIGEAVKSLSERTKLTCPEIPWRQIAGMRDKIVHEYFGVNLELVWGVVERDLPVLRRFVEDALSKDSGA